MTVDRLAHCPQVGQSAEVAQVVGDGTWLSTTEVAKLLGVSVSTVIRLVDEGELPATKVGTHRRIARTIAETYRGRMRREAGQQ